MKKCILVNIVLIIALLFLTGCNVESNYTEQDLSELNNRISALENKVESLEKSIQKVSKEDNVTAVTAEVPFMTPSPTPEKNFSSYGEYMPQDFFKYLPSGFIHPFPIDAVEKVKIIKEDILKIELLYKGQKISRSVVDSFTSKVGGRLEWSDNYSYDLPGGFVETEKIDYSFETDSYWDGEKDVDMECDAVYIFYKYKSSAPDVSEWFNDDLFAYEEYGLPQSLRSVEPAKKEILISKSLREKFKTVMEWRNLKITDLEQIADNYVELLSKNEYYDYNGNPSKGIGIYARLDEHRIIAIKTNVDNNIGNWCRITIYHDASGAE